MFSKVLTGLTKSKIPSPADLFTIIHKSIIHDDVHHQEIQTNSV